MRKLSTKDLTLAAMVAAVYTVLTVFLPIPQGRCSFASPSV